jgi:hypothetical protein
MTFRSSGLIQLAGRLVLGLEDLGVLVVDHRLGRVDLTGDEGDHVELLLDDAHVVGLAGIETGLDEAGVQLGLVAETPRPDLLALQLLGRRDALVLERDLQRR